MKKNYILIILALLCLLSYKESMAQVAVCKNFVRTYVNPQNCNVGITPSQIDGGSYDYDSLTLNTLELNAGLHLVTLSAKKQSGETATCKTVVEVLDKTKPVAVTPQNLVIDLGSTGKVMLDPKKFDLGSYDNCTKVYVSLNPSKLTCDSPNPSTVVVTVYDESGNSSNANVEVQLVQNHSATYNLACNAQVTINVPLNAPKLLDAGDILVGGPYYCPSYYKLQIFENNSLRGDNSITISDTNKILLGKVIEPTTGNACWGEIRVVQLDCSQQVSFCDKQNTCSPVTDCNSGHSLSDYIEWPCDLIRSIPTQLVTSPSPEFLALHFDLPIGEVKPQYVESECSRIFLTYTDQVIDVGDSLLIRGKKIIRIWEAINWMTGEQAFYNQYIKLLSPEIPDCSICDTKPWNTPLGDCTMGHTDRDAVEWPSEFIRASGGVSLQDLANDPLVHPNDVAPRIFTTCGNFYITFNDLLVTESDSVLVKRKWQILNTSSNSVDIFNQIIKAPINTSNKRTICVKNLNEQFIENVTIANNIVTNTSDCAEVEYDSNAQFVVPQRLDNNPDGIDIADIILLRQIILHETIASPIQNDIADVNKDGKPTAFDIVYIQNLINNEINAGSFPWLFFNVTNATLKPNGEIITYNSPNDLGPKADISNAHKAYHFIGQKIGDIDNSYGKVFDTVSIASEDIVMNKDEEYVVDLKVDRKHFIEGMQLDIMHADEMEILNIQSPSLPKFNETHVKSLTDRKRILWYDLNESPAVALSKDDVILRLNIKAKANTTLFTCLHLGEGKHNKLKSDNSFFPNYTVKLAWDNLILGNKEMDEINHYSIFPNPANEVINVTGKNDIRRIAIADVTSKILTEYFNIDRPLSIAHLESGIYFVIIENTDGKLYIRKLSIIR